MLRFNKILDATTRTRYAIQRVTVMNAGVGEHPESTFECDLLMLDVEALRSSKNRDADIKSALEGLKKDSGYLFEPAEVPPPFAAGTGTGGSGGTASGLDAIRNAALYQ